MRMWVHRLSAGASGAPLRAVDFDEVERDLLAVVKAIRTEPLALKDDLVGAEAFLRAELFDRSTLRQGWGTPGMDIRYPSRFKPSYVIAMWRYWRAMPRTVRDDLRGADGEASRIFDTLQPYFQEAAGRLPILERMNEMSPGDIVFIPNIPHHGTTFTVVRINDKGYEFEDRGLTGAEAIWQADYGHRRRVSDIKTFSYDRDTLESGAFGTPYLHAIDSIGCGREDEFRSFLERCYRG